MQRLAESFLDGYRGQQPVWGFNGLGQVIFKRTYARRVEGEGRTEDWWETVARVVNGAQEIGAGLTEDEARQLFDAMFHLKALPAGRVLWAMGSPIIPTIGADALLNCWFTAIRKPDDFVFLFNELLLGGGVGFSVRRLEVGELPVVKSADPQLAKHERVPDADFIVPDSREGWTYLARRVLDAYFVTGQPFTYSTILVRGKGEPIKTFGGTAAGPAPLIQGMERMQQVLGARGHQKLRAIDALDIANVLGDIVVSGNVRRSAQIAIGDPDDLSFLRAKRWDIGQTPSWRAMSNNTVDVATFDDVAMEFWEGYGGNGEPYGMFNMAAAQQFGRMGEIDPDFTIMGLNPCGEIPLGHRECCNLSELFLPRIESQGEMVELARLLYKVQKAITTLPYTDPETQEIVSQNRRLGLGIGGVAMAHGKLGWLRPTYEMLREFDEAWSRSRGLERSIRLTTVKPSGTISLLAGSTPGVHPGFSRYYVRRVQMGADDPLVAWSRDHGFRVEPVRLLGETRHDRVSVEFPVELPKETWLADGPDATALRQLEVARTIQRDWSDNAVSCTVYYGKDELPDIQTWLREHWPEMKSISFLLREDHGFEQAPYEPVSATEYADRRRSLQLDGSDVEGDTMVPYDELDTDCEGGVCPIR